MDVYRCDNIRTVRRSKKLILIKKKPNRKPFSQDNAVYSECGKRQIGVCVVKAATVIIVIAGIILVMPKLVHLKKDYQNADNVGNSHV